MEDLKGEGFENKQKSIIEYWKEHGFITGHGSNLCESNMFEMNEYLMKYLVNNHADHESIGFACDPNYHDPENSFSPYMGPFSILRRCLYGKDTYEYVFEFGRNFLSKYRNEQKVLMLDFIDMHEGTAEVINYLDAPMAKFLREI